MSVSHSAAKPITGPTVWTGSSLSADTWLAPLDAGVPNQISQLRLSLQGRSLSSITRKDFELPILLAWTEALKQRLRSGPGFLLIRGLNVSGWGEEEAKMIFWGLGSLLGQPRVQNLQGDRIHVVADQPIVSPGQTAPGGSTGNNEILPHTENARPPRPPRLICLMCLNQAPTGGDSLLYSGHEIYNRLLRDRPEVIPKLHGEFEFGRHAEEYPDGKRSDASPIFRVQSGTMRVRYGRYWINVAEKELGKPLDPAARIAVDAIDELLKDELLPFRFALMSGDMLVVDNDVVLHARTAFTDGPNAAQRRRLLRLWLD